MHRKLARVGVLSLGLFYALFLPLSTIVVGLIMAFVLPLIPGLEQGLPIPGADPNAPPLELGTMFRAMLAPEALMGLGLSLLAMAIVGFVLGVLTAIVYNLVALITGGIRVRVRDLGAVEY